MFILYKVKKIFYILNKLRVKLFKILRKIGKFLGVKQPYPINYIDKKKVEKEIAAFKGLGLNTNKCDKRILISLTSFPARMYDIHFAIYSLLNQSIKPDLVILWLGVEEFPGLEQDIPEKVLKLREQGLSIKWCKDLKSYNKLIPSLKEYPTDIVISADDDIYYPKNWLELLYAAYLKNSNYIHCHRAHRIGFNEKKVILPYIQWKQCVCNLEPSSLNFFTGVGGVLYPPNILHKDVLNENLFFKLCPNADDIWFWAMAVLNGVKINIVENNINTLIYVNPKRELGLSGEKTLFQSNRIENDMQLKNVLTYYAFDIYNRSN